MHVRRVGIFVVAIGLIVGIVGCGEPAEYTPMVATGLFHTVGLTSGGTVVTVGSNDWGQCDVGDWSSITRVTVSHAHTVGLKFGGTVVAMGWK
jgi:alpha-tubulin suppressor-like RCC1 family protein